jgi:Eukaryotic aspartyl protease
LTPPQYSVFYRDELDEAPKAAQQKLLRPGQKPVGRLMKKVADGGRHTTTEDIQLDSKYLTEVSFSGQKQSFQLDFDTGSSDLWVRVLIPLLGVALLSLPLHAKNFPRTLSCYSAPH